MSIKIAVGSKIYDMSSFSDHEKEDLDRLSKSLNYRVNQVISAFDIRDQEMALLISALSILEENENLKKVSSKPDTDLPNNNAKRYSEEDVESILLDILSSLTLKLKRLTEAE